jgi:deferrochelatase/peroxidase EfeB
VNDPEAFGSYFVFRKLEQDVLRFSIAEQQLADALKLTGADRDRAGAMAVGRFRDGTPLVLSETSGMIPAKSNNFRYDGLDPQSLTPEADAPIDLKGTKCPFHAHIRKTNPRQATPPLGEAGIAEQEAGDLGRRIVRRGIPYGTRVKHPNSFQSMSDLPEGGVGLLFACYQRSIIRQFAFMQKTWANNVDFRVEKTGIDPLIGQSVASMGGNPGHTWLKQYGETILGEEQPSISFKFSDFVRFRGGEFLFAPSLPFLLGKETKSSAKTAGF